MANAVQARAGVAEEAETKAKPTRPTAWSPDGRRLAYQRGETTGRAESAVVILSDPTGKRHRTLLADPDRSPSFTAPVWRPTGRVRHER